MATSTADLDTAAAVLEFARAQSAAANTAETAKLQAAVAWAAMHSVDSLDAAATVFDRHYGDTGVPVAGPGAPLVAEFCVAEFAAAVGLPTETGKAYLGEALELRHRLPQTWARVVAGDLAAWRARPIAPAPNRPSVAAGGVVGAPGGAVRHAHVHTDQVSFEGTVWVEAEVDLADALDLDTALSVGAARLADLGSTASLDVRRSESLGQMARNQLSLDLDTSPEPQRQVVLHVHLSDQAITSSNDTLHLARVQNTRSFVDADQVRNWCNHPGVQVTVKPIIDLTAHI